MNRNHMELHGSGYLACPLHVNTELEIIYVRSGSIHILYDGAEYDLGAAKAMVILPCRVHRFIPGDNVYATVFMFSYQLAIETLGNFLNFSAASDVFNVNDALGCYIDSLLETVKDKIEVTDNFLIPGIYYAFMNAYFVNNRFIACRKNDIIQQVINMVALETDDMPTIEKIAGKLGITRRTLSDTFTHQTGMKLKNFMRDICLERATNMLMYSNLSVTEIAYKCGFGSIRNFNRIFQQRYFCTPSEYRKSNDKFKRETDE